MVFDVNKKVSCLCLISIFFSILFKGIELRELIVALSIGIRLPTPVCCPVEIGGLIQSCFKEEPTDRPSFSDLKEKISNSHAAIRRAESNNKAPLDIISDQEVVQYADVQMEERYLDMRKNNKSYQEYKNSGGNENKFVPLEAASLVASSTLDNIGSYLSLQHMRSSVTEAMSTQHEINDSLLPLPVFPSQHTKLHSPISQQSPGSKRRFSLSVVQDQDFCTLPEKLYTGLSPAKSYPNPEYILNLAAHEEVKSSIEDKSVKPDSKSPKIL